MAHNKSHWKPQHADQYINLYSPPLHLCLVRVSAAHCSFALRRLSLAATMPGVGPSGMGISESHVEIKPVSPLSGNTGKIANEVLFPPVHIVKEGKSNLTKATKLICRLKPDSRMEIVHSTKLNHNTTAY